MEKLKKLYDFSNTWTGTVIIVSLAIFFVAQAFVIPSGSMKRTYQIGDFLLVKKFTYGIPVPHIPMLEIPVLPDIFGNGHLISAEGPQRGDVTVFRYPINPNIHYVKRCVAVGGDQLFIRNKVLYLRPHEGDEYIKANYLPGQIVTVNGELWVRAPYAHKHPGVHHDPEVTPDSLIYPEWVFNFGPVRVPNEHYFMVGDNREHSGDSRQWGYVHYKYIVGQPWFTYLSWENRTYDIALHGGPHNSPDHNALREVCGSDAITSDRCRDKWNDQMYKIRWERMFKGTEGLEDLLRK